MRILWWLGWLWCLPITALGVLACLVGGAKLRRVGRDGVLHFVAHKGITAAFFKRFGFIAFTWGACICFADESFSTDERLLRHELRHVVQGMWLGPFHPIAYGLASLWAVLRGRHAYRDNWFEVDARKAEGGG